MVKADELGQPGRKKCSKCDYVWIYTGVRKYFCCPNCLTNSRHIHIGN